MKTKTKKPIDIEPIDFCVNCKHCKRGEMLWRHCKRPIKTYRCAITGKTKTKRNNYLCETERNPEFASISCGPAAKYYEPKERIFKPVKMWFRVRRHG